MRSSSIVPFVGLFIALVSASAETLVGRFALRPVVAVYVVADGQPCRLHLTVRQGSRPAPERVMVRLFNPAEQVLYRRYVEYLPADLAPPVPNDTIELRDAAQPPSAGDILVDTTVELTEAGVYQIRVVGGSHNSVAELALSRPLGYGVSFQNGDFTAWRDDLAEAYAYLPPHAEGLTVVGGPVSVYDDVGRVIESAPGATTDIPVTATDTVWRFAFPARDWSFRAAGLPLILCDSKQAAREIRASVILLSDGTVVCHRFQADIAKLLPQLLTPERVGRADDLVVPLRARRDAWLAEPLRNLQLVGGYLPAIEHWLRRQNVDPHSHWGGSLDGWQERADRPGPEGRWDRLRGVDGLYAGASSHYGAAAEHLALAALYDHPTNPYYGRTELLYRAAAAALRDLMALSEDETWPGIADLDPYPGVMAFPSAQKTFPVFGRASPHLPDDVRAVWAEGLRHIVDRHFPDSLVSARNQSSHYLVAFQAFADGTAEPADQALARIFATRWVLGQHPAGFHQEATGPCASYIGMTHWHEAVYYRMSGDRQILDSLRRSYRLFNHTVAPEPDGRVLGGFNFNHRVGDGFFLEQWGGAKGILDDVLPEVGVWADPRTPDAEAKAIGQIEAFLADPKMPAYPDQTTWRYLCWGEPDRSQPFPAMEPQPFWRLFADELLAVKRPAYYAYCWVGKPAAGEFYIRGREAKRQATEAESTGGEVPDLRKVTPFLGGGLSGFWTPECGHVLLAAPWAPTTHHGLIATRADGQRYWEDYFASAFSADETAGTLVVSGRVEDVPLGYRRTYRFDDDALTVELQLTADAEVALTALVECLPVARGEWKARGATIRAGEVTAGTVEAGEFEVVDAVGAGARFILDRPRTLRLVPDGLRTGGWRRLQIGRVEIDLPRRWAKGDSVSLTYRIAPAPSAAP